MEKESELPVKTSIGVTIVIFIAKLLGFVRDIFFASIFGTTILTDISRLFSVCPVCCFPVSVQLISSVNIPNLTYYLSSKTPEERFEYISRLFAQITFWGSVISVVGIIFAPHFGQADSTGH